MANNNRRCNSYSPWWVNLSRETRGWAAQTAGGQSHINKLLRLNDWVHGSEGLEAIQQSDMKAVSEITGIQSKLSVLKVTTMSTALILQSGQLLIYAQSSLYQVHLSTASCLHTANHVTTTWIHTVEHSEAFEYTWTRHVIKSRTCQLVLFVALLRFSHFLTKWYEQKNAHTPTAV